MTNKITRLIKRMTEEPFPTDGSLYDLGDGKLYQTTDGYTFHAVGDVSMLQNGCTSGACNNTLEVPTTTKEIKTVSNDIFADILGYTDIKREFYKALQSVNPVGILLVGPPGCGKSEFLKQIGATYDDKSVFIDGSYGSKAGIFEKLYKNRPKYILLDEIDKLSGQDQLALLNLMESGKLTKTTRSESYEIKLNAWVFATANNKEDILEPLFDRFETYFLTEYSDEEFREIAVRRLKQEGIEDEELALYIANSVLRALNRKSLRDAIRIARKCKTFAQVEETVQTIKRYSNLE